MRALSMNLDAAQLMGIDVNRTIRATFAIGSALAAAGGILFGLDQITINPLMGVLTGLKAFVAAVLGGIGNIPGAVRRRPLDRPRRAAHGRLPLARLSRRDHVRDPDRDPAREARGPARRRAPGEGVMATAALERQPRWPSAGVGARSSSLSTASGSALAGGLDRVRAAHRAARRHQRDPGGRPQPDQRHDRAVLDRPRRLHGGRRLRLRPSSARSSRPSSPARSARARSPTRVTFNLALRRRRAARRRSRASSSGCRACACAGDYLAIVTLGFGEIIRILFNNATVSRRRDRLLRRFARRAARRTPASSGSISGSIADHRWSSEPHLLADRVARSSRFARTRSRPRRWRRRPRGSRCSRSR